MYSSVDSIEKTFTLAVPLLLLNEYARKYFSLHVSMHCRIWSQRAAQGEIKDAQIRTSKLASADSWSTWSVLITGFTTGFLVLFSFCSIHCFVVVKLIFAYKRHDGFDCSVPHYINAAHIMHLAA